MILQLLNYNSEAAFQCTKWCNDPNARQAFESDLTGNDAWRVKKNLQNPDYTYAGFMERWCDVVYFNS